MGVPVVDIHSQVDQASVQLLRSELELSGMGTRLAVIAVTRATRVEGASGLALALARTFAGVGTATILVSADLRGRTVREQEGLSALLDGTATSMPLIALEENLMWLPEGTSNAPPETLFSAPRVERIVRDLRDVASVVVIDTAGRARGLRDAAADRLLRHRASDRAPRRHALESAGRGRVADPARRQAAVAHLLRPGARQQFGAGGRCAPG